MSCKNQDLTVVKLGPYYNTTVASVLYDEFGKKRKIPIFTCTTWQEAFEYAHINEYQRVLFLDSGTVILDWKKWQSQLEQYPHNGFIAHIKYHSTDTVPDIDDQALTLMPNTVAFFKNNFTAAEYKRVRVMLLEPGGYITVHKDYKSNRLGPVNIAITQPNGCHFVMDNHGEIPFSPGKSFMLDVGNLHTVVNHSDLPRYHIIVHSKPSQKFKKTVVDQYNFLYNNLI